MTGIPETTRIRRRPVYARMMLRREGHPLVPPTEAEKHDAIEVLRHDLFRDELYAEAERIFAEAAVEHTEPVYRDDGRYERGCS